MAKIKLSNSTFSLVPEGTHVFQITAVEYKPDFDKLNITMKTATGATHIERFTFTNSNGEPNEAAINIFSYLAQTALQNYDLEEIDEQDLVGCYIKAEVTHDVLQNRNDPTKTVTFSRLGKKYPANGFDDEEEQPVKTPVKPVAARPAPVAPSVKTTANAASAVPQKKHSVDLSAILGRK